jgi:ABC-type nitrate/sulfonate/bicarbonate transport system substrate-binding protein
VTPLVPLVRRSLRIAVIFFCLALLTACAGTPDLDDPDARDNVGADGSQPVTLMLNWTPNAHHAGIYLAQERGYYAEAGIDLAVIEPGAEIGAVAAVAQRRVEFGISQAESLLPARAAGMDLQAIATLLPVNDSVLMGLDGSGLGDDPASLAGLVYGGYGGALETEIMSELVQCGGGDPDAVEFIDIGNVDYLAGLERKRFDVTWVFGGWDALRAQAERDDVAILRMSDHQDCIPNWYTPVIVGNASVMAEDPGLAESFLEATSRGYEAIATDPEAGARAVAYYADLFAAQGRFGEMEEAVWQQFTEFLVQARLLEDESPLENAWTNDYLPEG